MNQLLYNIAGGNVCAKTCAPVKQFLVAYGPRHTDEIFAFLRSFPKKLRFNSIPFLGADKLIIIPFKQNQLEGKVFQLN